MEIKTVVNNGVTIPNESTCVWCGGKCIEAVPIIWELVLISLHYGAIIVEQ